MQYVIKKHSADPFRIPVYAEQEVRQEGFVGYLADVDLNSLTYVTVGSEKFATRFNMYNASLLVAKLNKLNLRFYEIEEI